MNIFNQIKLLTILGVIIFWGPSVSSIAQEDSPALTQNLPYIEFFQSSADVIHKVEPVRLWWRVQNSVRVDVYDGFRNTTYPQLGNENYIEVWPEKTSKYVLYAHSEDGRVVTQEIIIRVEYFIPTIEFFQANPTKIERKQPVRLSWRVRDANTVDVFDVEKNQTFVNLGSENYIEVWPERTSRYILYARGFGSQMATAEVLVKFPKYPPLIDFFDASAFDIFPNDPVGLRWKTSFANRVEIFDGPRNVTFSVGTEGSINVYPERSGYYYLYAYNDEGKVSSQYLYIRVRPRPR